MTQSELKEKLYDLVAVYFASLDPGNIVWGKTKPLKPNSPMVSLGLAQVQRPYRPARQYVDGVIPDSYPSSTILRIDLFTKGAPTTDKPNVTAQNENTAVNDLSDFANFLNSVYVDHWCGNSGVSLRARTVQDLTAINNETSWQYRALLEIDVGFMQNATGHTATSFEGGVPLHVNGKPMYNSETGMPLYDNGQPMYDDHGYPLDMNGDLLPDGETAPLAPLDTDDEGVPIMPPVELTSSGGRSQELAKDFTGFFTEVEGPEDTSAILPKASSAKIEYKKEAPRYG